MQKLESHKVRNNPQTLNTQKEEKVYENGLASGREETNSRSDAKSPTQMFEEEKESNF